MISVHQRYTGQTDRHHTMASRAHATHGVVDKNWA